MGEKSPALPRRDVGRDGKPVPITDREPHGISDRVSILISSSSSDEASAPDVPTSDEDTESESGRVVQESDSDSDYDTATESTPVGNVTEAERQFDRIAMGLHPTVRDPPPPRTNGRRPRNNPPVAAPAPVLPEAGRVVVPEPPVVQQRPPVEGPVGPLDLWPDPHVAATPARKKARARSNDEKTISHIAHDILSNLPDFKVFGNSYNMLPNSNPYEMDEVTDMMAGEYFGGQGENADGCIGGGTINTSIPLSNNKHRTKLLEKLRMREKKAEMPILAGEVSFYLKSRHGVLVDSGNNRNLIRADAAKFVTSLYLSEKEPYAGLGWKDIAPIVEYGALLYWIPSYDEVSCESMRRQFAAQIRIRASWAAPPDV